MIKNRARALVELTHAEQVGCSRVGCFPCHHGHLSDSLEVVSASQKVVNYAMLIEKVTLFKAVRIVL